MSGVYRLCETDQKARELTAEFFSRIKSEEMEDCGFINHFKSAVLIELLVLDRDGRFSVGDFVQKQPDVQPRQWQAAWAEAFLVLDGSALVFDRWKKRMPALGDLRIAFFIHYWMPSLPLHTSYGDVTCSQPQEMPGRLARLVTYEMPD